MSCMSTVLTFNISHAQVYELVHSGRPSVPGDIKPELSMPEQDVKATSQSSHGAASSTISDGDEGRYRTHPLYSRGPASDGLYHCPYLLEESEENNCGHKPTKLKCNYE